jgi:hypothetical protein
MVIGTTVADLRWEVQTRTEFLLKVRADIVTG